MPFQTFATKEGGEEGRKQTAFFGNLPPKEEEKRVGNRLAYRGIRQVGIEGGGEEGRKQTAFLGNSLCIEGGGEEDRKQTAFPGNLLTKEEEKRVENRLPFQGIRY